MSVFNNIVYQFDLEKTHLKTKLILQVTFNDQTNYQKKRPSIIPSNKKNIHGFYNFNRFIDYTNNVS